MSEKAKTILIVDDEKDLNEAACEVLRDEGFDVLSAHNGKEGLEMALEHKPNLIFLDIIMPVMDGIEMLKKLKQDEWGKEAHVIVMSVVDDMEKIAEVLELGGNGYIIKAGGALDEIVQKAAAALNA